MLAVLLFAIAINPWAMDGLPRALDWVIRTFYKPYAQWVHGFLGG